MTDFQKRQHRLGYIEAFPRPSAESLAQFYQDEYYRAGVSATYHVQYSEDELKQKSLRAAAINEAIFQNLAPDKKSVSFLEIGSGEGFLLADAIGRGWVSRGVDFQRDPVEKFNPRALPGFIEANPSSYLAALVESGEKFSAVALQNVLEHALHPDVLMRDIRNVIEPDGIVLVQVPNDYSRTQELATAKGYVDREYWFLPPQHLNYFNVKTLDAFVSANGFKIVDGFSDFPIEFYLWGNQTNYTKDKTLGPLAHKGRVEIDLLAAEAGLSEYLNFYRAVYRVGLGRNISVLLRPAAR
jgi:2-polyprenyl-3-methyl-5-hydroxy-6-metoxy-1,4-benzoquinol methylase